MELEKILIAEDKDEIREILLETLISYNFDCSVAKDGEEALQKCKENYFDCILSDIQMPNLSGIDFLAKINALNYTPPVVFLTALKDSEMVKKALRLGAIDFINKPFETQEIIDVVNRAVQIGLRKKQIFLNQDDKSKNNEKRIKALKSINYANKKGD